jgi:antitoxin (DNA-binding transcriptional repressor) of toxin-antitoxin stability system
MVHDAIVINSQDQSAGQIEITARGKPVFRVKPISQKSVNTIRTEILDFLALVLALHKELLAEIPSLKKIPPPESDPTRVSVSQIT